MTAESDPQKFVAKINVLNSSTLVDNSTAEWYATVCAKQLREHLCPMWALPTCTVRFAVDEASIDPDAELVVLLDDSDTAGALGYHDLTPLGNPYAKVFCRSGGVLVTLSHECCEMVLDPLCDTFDTNPKDGLDYAREASDAVEADTYAVDGEQVSAFLLPGFFDLPPRVESDRTGAELLSFGGTVTEPFQTAPGGYQIVRDPKTGGMSQVYGESRDAWRAAGKEHPAARTATRLAGKKRGMRT